MNRAEQARERAQRAFQSGSAQTAKAALDKPLPDTSRDSFVRANKDIEEPRSRFLKRTVKEGVMDVALHLLSREKREKVEAERNEIILRETQADKRIQVALANAENPGATEEQLRELEGAYRAGFEAYVGRYSGAVEHFRTAYEDLHSPDDDPTGIDHDPSVQEYEEMKKAARGPEWERVVHTLDGLLKVQLRRNAQLRADLDAALDEAEQNKSEATLGKVHALATQYHQFYAEYAKNYERLGWGELGAYTNAMGQVASAKTSEDVFSQMKAISDMIADAEAALFVLKGGGAPPPSTDPSATT